MNQINSQVNAKLYAEKNILYLKRISDDAISKIWGAALGITPHLTMGLSRNASEFFPDIKLEKGRTILR